MAHKFNVFSSERVWEDPPYFADPNPFIMQIDIVDLTYVNTDQILCRS